ncbi:MAG: pyridoxal kinase [Filomicrobium sp.]
MAKILAVSSYVASGSVGLAAIVPTLQAFGHEVIAVPAVVLSNHYGYANVGVSDVDPAEMEAIFAALEANGVLADVASVLTGYFPSDAHVAVAAKLVGDLKTQSPGLTYLCDPVLGDDPGGLYVAKDAAIAIKTELVGQADILTPNRFELSWLSGLDVDSTASALDASASLPPPLVTATSIPEDRSTIANTFSAGGDDGHTSTPRLAKAAHGTGDLYAAMILGHLLDGYSTKEAVLAATAGVAHVVEASGSAAELQLIASLSEAVQRSRKVR